MPSPETPRHPLASLLWGHCSFLLGPGAQGSVVPSKSLFLSPVQVLVGLMMTSSKRTYAIPRSAAPRAPAPAAVHCQPVPLQETLKHSSGSVSVESLGPGAYKVCLSPLSISGRKGFDSKWESVPPTVLLGLLLCPWTWGISSQPLQCHTATAPAPRSHWSSAHRLAGAPLPLDRLISSQLLQCRAAATAVPHSGTRI